MIAIPAVTLFLILGSTAPALRSEVAVPAGAPVMVERTVRAGGAAEDVVRPFDPTRSTIRTIGSDGVVSTRSWTAERRVLIELEARPLLDRNAPGSLVETSRQRQELLRDLAALDARLKPRVPTRIRREYWSLFSGVAATVDSAILSEIRRLPNVAAVYEDHQVEGTRMRDAPAVGGSPAIATTVFTGAGVKVAVIDTGIDYTHPDLGGCFGGGCKVAGGYDFVNEDADPFDDDGHGTHVAGILAADGTLKGVARGATLLAYKVLNDQGHGYSSDVIAGLERAVQAGARIANLSLGGSGSPDDPTARAVDNATAAGMLCVVSAGNGGSRYFSVDSPGVARTALTVGAVDAASHVAGFSSRGYVTDGDEYVMKPEVVAPGVDITSTVPKSGRHGDPSGYATLSGTSMAAPYVAGAAAVLLEWNGAQSPSDLKRRLVGSAHTTGAHPFAEGAGKVDLAGALDLRFLSSLDYASFGVVEARSGVVSREQLLSVRNTGSTSETMSLVATSTLPVGTTLEIVPSSLTLGPGQSANVTLRLRVDAAVTPEPPDPLAWTARLSIGDGTQTVGIPLYFLRASILTLSFSEPPLFVDLVSESGNARSLDGVPPMTLLLGSGRWDVLAIFLPPYPEPISIVVREQVEVRERTSLDIDRSEATHQVKVRSIDDAQQPLQAQSLHMYLALVVDPPGRTANSRFALDVGTGEEGTRVSDLSPRFAVGLMGGGPDASGARFFTSDWSGRGLSSDLLLPFAGVPYRTLGFAAAKPPGVATAGLYMMQGFVFDRFGFFGGSGGPDDLDRTLYLQSSAAPDLPLAALRNAEVTTYDASGTVFALYGPYLQKREDGEIAVSTSPFDFLPEYAPYATFLLLDEATQRWDPDLAPPAFALDFRNSTSIQAYGDDYSYPYWTSQTLGWFSTVASEKPSVRLYRDGVLVGAYPTYELGYGIPMPYKAYEVRSTLEYAIGGGSGSSEVVASFDTGRYDRDPPYVSHFRIEQNGARTATPVLSATVPPIVRFGVTDASTPSVTMSWRPNGTIEWQPLSVTHDGSEYAVPVEEEGPIDLQLIATDTAGNSIRDEWKPAMVVSHSPAPTTPDFVVASRVDKAAVRVTWAPSSSLAGIAGYRIERFPDQQTFNAWGTGTSFVDEQGLVPGNAYFYRVSAIDSNGLVSSPTGYDVATLLAFEDDPIRPWMTLIRGVHVANLRRAVDAIRAAAGLPTAWTDYAPPTGIAKASDFATIRDRLAEARNAMHLPPMTFVHPFAPGVIIYGYDVQKLREGAR